MASLHAPSYAQSQFDTIIRRQQDRTGPKLRKSSAHESIAQVERNNDGPASRGLRDWDCSPWGVISYVEVDDEDRKRVEAETERHRRAMGERTLGSALGTSVAGVAVAGSPLYAFPPVVAVAGIYAPLCLLIVTVVLALWRPFIVQLATALPRSGSNYFYLLNVSSHKSLAMFAGVLTALDSIATAVVSAATAASYLAEQTSRLSIATWLTVVFLVAIACMSLGGLRQSASATAAILVVHMAVMTMLMIAGIVQWGKHGNHVLAANWSGLQYGSATKTARAIFEGVCIGFLGVTGFESSPDYLTLVRRNKCPSILRNLQAIAIYLNAPLMLVTFAVLPSASISQNPTVLSALAQASAGTWLRILLAVNAVLILGAGVLTGIISAAELLTRLTEDGVAPRIFARVLPRTGAPHVSIVVFTGLCLAYYGAGAADLTVLSGIFAIAFLSLMALFPLSALLLEYARPRLATEHRAPVLSTAFTLAFALVLFIGNVVLAPSTLGYFAAYVAVLSAVVFGYGKRVGIAKLLWWLCERSRWTRRWCPSLAKHVSTSRSGPVIVFTRTDEVSRLFGMLSYVRANETTTNVKLVHFYASVDTIPSELEANYKIVDEAFPAITVDLVFVQGTFDLVGAHVVCEKYGVPHGMAFIGCPDKDKGDSYEDFRDMRIISQ